ncbi:MAG TPA: MATE family efflux transporter, partial [Candidatus Evtepia faecigallinarum]|nr:MATE family efflux transporter [Candidatus Evtepia faecigallinarum]
MEERSNRYLAQAPIGPLILKFAVPCTLSLLVSSLYNIVDQIFIGWGVGYLGNGATNVVFPITIIALALALMIGDGCAAYLSLCQGQGDTQRSHQCVGSGITVLFLLGVVLAAVCLIWQEPLLRLFGASDATLPLAVDYFTILLWVFPLYMLSNMAGGVIRADGSPRFAMAATVAGAIVNIILDPVFIFGLHWGIQGAAWATVLGQLLSFVLNFVYLLRPKTFRLTPASFRPHWRVFGRAVQLGISTFITQISIVVVSLVCNVMLFHYGSLSVYGPDIPISVISIETKVYTIVINIVVGVVLGGQPILGYNYGAGKYDRVRQTYRLILAVTVVVGVAATLLFQFWPQGVVAIFGQGDPLYEEFAVLTFRLFLALV